MKSLFSSDERHFASAISSLIHCNHFLPERIDLEKSALGGDFHPHQAAWNLDSQSGGEHPNIALLSRKSEALLRSIRTRTATNRSRKLVPGDETLLEGLTAYVMYRRYRERLLDLMASSPKTVSKQRITFYADFVEDLRALHAPFRSQPVSDQEAAIGFALLFQVERAFSNIFRYIAGNSAAIARLRAAVWQSVFTHNMARYRRGLFNRMRELTTLITGPSGTGKELVARAIAWSSYIPFDAKRGVFTQEFRDLYLPLNLSALADNLVEAELFGCCKGAFTGAHLDRTGWLESCPPGGSLFLDEIGEISSALQVKLLRVLQDRTLQRIGESKNRQFAGKIIAATNRDLSREVREGRFREDFYYRLCSDVISTPSLEEQLRDAADSLPMLVRFIAGALCEPEEQDRLSNEAVDWIRNTLPPDYAWPGNFRELEQCVRNILVRGEYTPIGESTVQSEAVFAGSAAEGRLTASELLRRYCALVYEQTGSLEQTAKRLQLDRRTVRSKLGLAPNRQ